MANGELRVTASHTPRIIDKLRRSLMVGVMDGLRDLNSCENKVAGGSCRRQLKDFETLPFGAGSVEC